jgi:hypothetical protein
MERSALGLRNARREKIGGVSGLYGVKMGISTWDGISDGGLVRMMGPEVSPTLHFLGFTAL